MGSTEWVEEYVNWLAESAVVYLNIDVGVSGKSPSLSATPELSTIATDIMKKVMWPTMPNETLYDAWSVENDGEVGVLGSGSDYTSFLHNGISSLDVGSDQGADDPVYHYHRYVCSLTRHQVTLYSMALFPTNVYQMPQTTFCIARKVSTLNLMQQLRLLPLDVHVRRPRLSLPRSHGTVSLSLSLSYGQRRDHPLRPSRILNRSTLLLRRPSESNSQH